MAETYQAPQAPGSQQGPAPLPPDGFGSLAWWQSQIRASEEKVKRYEPSWKKNVAQLTATPLQIRPTVDTVVVPIDFANVEQKKAQLYFKNPEVQLSAAPGYESKADAVQAFGYLLNETLGPDVVDAEAMMDEMLTDVLCPSGMGVTVLGIELAQDGTKQIQIGEQPAEQPGSVLGLTAPMVPILADVPNIIHQRYFWSRVSPLCALIPDRFHGSTFDKAPWLGYAFEMDKAVAMTTLGLTEEEAAQASGEPKRLNIDEEPKGRDTEVVYGYCLSYKASLFRSDVKHPEEIWRLIVMKGVERIIANDRPYQRYTSDGQTLIGLMGHFVHIYTPRYVSDSAFPPSDVSMSRHQVDELSKGRSQMIQQRDRARPMRQLNINLVDPAQKQKIIDGEWQELLLSTSSDPIALEIAHAQYPRENFEFNRIINQDISTAWALGNVQRGIAEETRRTATELSIQQGNSDTRLERERNRLAKWYARGAQKLGGLLQLFEDTRTTVQIIGDDGVQKLVNWNLKELPFRFVCTAKPDTMVRQDAAGEFKRALDLYQMTANDPQVNRKELVIALFRKANLDPGKLVAQQPPEKGPEPPKLSIAIKGEDLNPTSPQFPIVQEMLTANGVPISAANVELGIQLAAKQQALGGAVNEAGGQLTPGQAKGASAHGGAVQQQEPLSKHQGDQSGKLDGMGMAGAVN